MSVAKYLEKIKNVQINLLDFLGDDTIDDKFGQLVSLLSSKNEPNEHEFKLILYIILNIVNNHHRNSAFFNKIFSILLFFKDKIKQNFTNLEIFNLFKSNKRILLFLLENEIIKKDDNILALLQNQNIFNTEIGNYFYPEIEQFCDKKEIYSEYDKTTFDQIRKIGENDNYICELIRKDIVDEFIVFVNRKCIKLDSKIKNSIFETNSFLIGKQPTLIEYCAFFGSIQIFNYLRLNHVELTVSLWPYAIHGNNPELIHILETECPNFDNENFLKIIKMCIRCHHNDIANYFIDNFMKDNIYESKIIKYSLKYYNFALLHDENFVNDSCIINYLCKYNYYDILTFLIKNEEFDINNEIEKLESFNNFNVVEIPMLQLAAKNDCHGILSLLLSQLDMNIENICFKRCNNLSSIKIPSSVRSIKESGFESCTSLTSISFEIPSSITAFKKHTFMLCTSLVEVSIPSSVKKIGRNCFRCCRSLVHITIPSSVTSIKKYAFFECSSLKEIEIPQSINVIEEYTFYNCISLSKVTIPSSITSIDSYAFYNCLSITHITIPPSVISIGNCVFKKCESLSQIVYSPSVKFGHYVFDGCTSLKKI